jgi:flagellar hook-length control protein FliK
VVVDRPATLDLLQRDARNLERILQDAGLQTDSGSLSFSLRNSGGDAQGQSQGGGTGRGNRGGTEGSDAAATAAAQARPAVVATADGYVDLET